MQGIGDTTMRAIEYALEGTRVREDVHAHNIANATVPGYRARRVDFEGQLARALDRGAARVDPITTGDAGGVPNHQGNTVALEGEMVGMLKNNLVQESMVAAYNFKTTVLCTAMGR